MTASDRVNMEGRVKPGFEAVRETFIENFTRRRELGGGCCAYYRGEKVVDLWGGVRDKQTDEPWERDTMVVVHSATKGLAAMTLAVAHSRGWLDYEERVCKYWPEFAQQGKEKITVRQLLAHQAGLFAINEPVDRGIVADLDRLAMVLARQKPAWEPGTRQGYHGLTLGFYEGELLRRVDPKHRSLGKFFEDEIAAPLGLNLYMRLPEEIPNSRLATIAPPGRMAIFFGFPFRLAIDAMNPHSNIYRALEINPGTNVYFDEQRIYARNLEVPSGNAVGTAQAIARAYSVFASGGAELGLRRETRNLLAAPAIPPTHGFYDECIKGAVQFSLGFMKPSTVLPFGSASSFGSPGAGGAMGFADPEAGVGYAYVTSQMGTRLSGDPREVALRDAVYAAIKASPRTMRQRTAAWTEGGQNQMSNSRLPDPAERSRLMRLFYRDWRPTSLGRWINRLNCWWSGSGLPPRFQAALETRGRVSGRRRSTPVVIAGVEGKEYLVSMLGPDSEWVKNIEAAHGDAVIRHGRRRRVHLVAVPAEQRAAIIREYVRIAPGGRRHFPLDFGAPLSEFEAIAHQYPVFRIDEFVPSVVTERVA